MMITNRTVTFWCYLFCFALFLVGSIYLAAVEGSRTSDQYIADHLTTKDGLPQNTIYAVSQDKDGYIWIGTDAGLVRYDGAAFTHFNRANTPAIKVNSITALLTANDGTLWIGTFGGGIVIRKKNIFIPYSSKNGLPNDFIQNIHQDSRGDIRLGTLGGGLIYYRNGRFDVYSVNDGLSDNTVKAICEDHNGNIWVGTENGLNRITNETIAVYSIRPGSGDHHILSLLEDSRGVLWVGTTKGLTSIKRKRIAHFTMEQGLSNNTVRGIFEDKDKNIWITTDNGLNRIDNASPSFKNNPRIEPFTFGEGVAANSLKGIFQDREGNLWVGSSGEGLYVLHQSKLSTYTTSGGLTGNHIKTICQDKSGAMWIGTNGGGLNLMKGSDIFTYSTTDGLAGNFVYSILQDIDGSMWIGTGSGLSHFANGIFISHSGNSGMGNPNANDTSDDVITDAVRVLFLDSKNILRIGTYGSGLFRLDRRSNHFHSLTTGDGLSNNFVLCITEDTNGNLWIGTNNGLNRLRNQTEDKGELVEREKGWPECMIYDIYPDADGALWIGTNGNGLYCLKKNRITRFTTADGMFNNTIYRILPDDRGHLWMSSNRGIFMVSISELNQKVRGIHTYLSCKYFTEADGMKSSVCTGGGQPSGIKTMNDHLWFPTTKGIVVLDPWKVNFNPHEPPVYIEHMAADGFTASEELPAGTNEIKFNFTALSFTAPAKVRFRYRLKGYDDRWFETASRAPAVFRQVPPGNYTFEVTACNNDGIWNSENASLSFSIAHPFYETLWFYFLLALVVTSALIWFHIMPEIKRRREREQNEKYQASTMSQPRSRAYRHKLLQYMEKEKPFLDPEVSAASLAEAMGIPLKHLSQVINQELNKNFKNFINEYRVDEAKKKLLDPRERDFVLLKIALDVGFNSKSAFNAAFKKFTGMSPTEYRKKNQD